MKCGLIGEKLTHSFSAEIHRQLFDYEYRLIEVSADQLDTFMKDRRFSAINVTLPYKEAVIPYLDVVDEAALHIGAVNTIVNRDGNLYGYNTDFDGLYAMVQESGISLSGKKVLILGSGGTSKTALAVANAFDCASVMRVSRIEREDCITYDQAYANCGDAQILINATPCGMYPNLETISVDLDRFPKLEGVVDVVYNPLRTRFVCDAQSRGLKAVGGLYMLVAQAVAAAERFTGQTVDKRRVNEIYNRLLLDKENVVLVGMPGCGKTTVGKLLASLLGKTFLDIDELVVNKTGLSISELFNQVGEDGFRRIETEVIREIASKQGAVIATGGGAILRRENVLHLKQNGRIYFLDRAVEKLPVSEDRPLSATPLALQQRYKERYPIYTTVCDVRIEADGMPHEVANFIREDLLYANFGFERS